MCCQTPVEPAGSPTPHTVVRNVKSLNELGEGGFSHPEGPTTLMTYHRRISNNMINSFAFNPFINSAGGGSGT